jgi:NAD(P)-dependent dehydrogenase (short-subunit alcohol dehydrogenase family)
METRDQPALVTGGASGLGAEAARALARQGAKVALLDVNVDAARKLAAEIGGVAVRCDVADARSAEEAVAQAGEAHGPARILVSAAGIGVAKRMIGKTGPMALEEFSRVIAVNLIVGRPGEYAALVLHVIANLALNGEVIRPDGGLRLPPR